MAADEDYDVRGPAERSPDNELPPQVDNNLDPVDTNTDDRREAMDEFLKKIEGNDKPDPPDPPPPVEPPEIGDILDAELGGLPDDFEIPAAEAIAPDAPQTPQEPLPVTFSEESTEEPSDGPKAADTLLEHLERFGNFDEDFGQDPQSGGATIPDLNMDFGGGGGGGDSGGSDGGSGPSQEDYDASYAHSEALTDYSIEHTRKLNELTARLERERI